MRTAGLLMPLFVAGSLFRPLGLRAVRDWSAVCMYCGSTRSGFATRTNDATGSSLASGHRVTELYAARFYVPLFGSTPPLSPMRGLTRPRSSKPIHPQTRILMYILQSNKLMIMDYMAGLS